MLLSSVNGKICGFLEACQIRERLNFKEHTTLKLARVFINKYRVHTRISTTKRSSVTVPKLIAANAEIKFSHLQSSSTLYSLSIPISDSSKLPISKLVILSSPNQSQLTRVRSGVFDFRGRMYREPFFNERSQRQHRIYIRLHVKTGNGKYFKKSCNIDKTKRNEIIL